MASIRRTVQQIDPNLPVFDVRTQEQQIGRLMTEERLFAALRDLRAQTLLVSGGFTFFTDRLRARLGIDHVLANTLEVVDGRLTGRVVGDIVDADAKAHAFAELAERYRGGDGVAIAIGDGANDLPMLKRADVSVAYHAKPIVRASATHAIDHCGLDAVLNLFAEK